MSPTAPGRGTAARWWRSPALALSLYAVAPLALLPGGYSRFVVPKLVVSAVALAIAARSTPAGRLPRWLVTVVGLGSGWLVIAALVSAAPWAQLAGRWPRYEGLVALPLYLGALWAGARLLGPGAERPHRLTVLQRGLSVAVVAVAAVAVAEAFGLRPLGGEAQRPGSLLGNASHQGSFGVLVLGLLLTRAVGGRDAWAWAGCVGAGVAVATSGSRAALLGTAVTVAVVAAGLVGTDRRRAHVPVTAAVATLAWVAAVTWLLPGTGARLTGADALASASIDGRVLLWQDSARMVASQWWAGVGPSGFVDAIPAWHSDAWRRTFGTANPPDSPHNVALQMLVAGGVPLALLAAVGCWFAVRQVRRALTTAGDRGGARRPPVDTPVLACLAALTGYATTLLFGFTTSGVTIPALVLAGMLVAIPVASPARGRTDGRRAHVTATAWTLIGLVWAAVLGAGLVGDVALRQATDAAAQDDTERAGTLFDQAQRWRPWDPDVALLATTAFSAGVAAQDADQAAQALAWTERALVRTPTSPEVLVRRARALGVAGRAHEGLEIARTLLVADPLNADLLSAGGILAAQTGDLEAALGYFVAQTDVAPDDADAWFNVAVLARATGDDDLATRAQARADELDAATTR